MIEVDQEGDEPARQHALEQFRIGRRIVGMRLELDRHADPPRVRCRLSSARPPCYPRLRRQMENRPSGLQEARRFAAVRPERGRTGRQIRHERSMTVTVADIEAARRTIAGQVLRTPMLPAPQAVGADRRRGVRQIREPAGHQLVQGARRAQQARLARRRPSARAASSPCRPAITPRRSPITPRGSASRPPS